MNAYINKVEHLLIRINIFQYTITHRFGNQRVKLPIPFMFTLTSPFGPQRHILVYHACAEHVKAVLNWIIDSDINQLMFNTHWWMFIESKALVISNTPHFQHPYICLVYIWSAPWHNLCPLQDFCGWTHVVSTLVQQWFTSGVDSEPLLHPG